MSRLFGMKAIFQDQIKLAFFLEKRNMIQEKDIFSVVHHIELPLHFQKYSKERKTEFLRGRNCAQEALKQLYARDQEFLGKYGIGVNKDRSPSWPSGITGSITHNKNWIMSCVSYQNEVGGVGVDIEDTLRFKTLRKVGSKILTGKEEKLGTSIENQMSPHDFLTLIFSSKEALFKCLYPLCKIFFYFKDAEVIKINLKEGRFTFRLNKDLGDVFKKGDLFEGRYEKVEDDLLTLVTL
jgi:enterobactin synthetase component D